MDRPAPAEIKLLPAYSVAEAARYLGTNASTLRAWFDGRNYTATGEQRRSEPVLADRRSKGVPISFLDLVEAHVLLAIRRGYGIPLKHFRAAMDYLRTIDGDLHFLGHRDFFHDKKHLFVNLQDRLVSLSERGQTVDPDILKEGLRQLRYGVDGYAGQFFPTRDHERQESIVLDPTVNFGRPCLARLAVGADAINARFVAGERLKDLAEDYGATFEEVEEAIRWVRGHDQLAA